MNKITILIFFILIRPSVEVFSQNLDSINYLSIQKIVEKANEKDKEIEQLNDKFDTFQNQQKKNDSKIPWDNFIAALLGGLLSIGGSYWLLTRQFERENENNKRNNSFELIKWFNSSDMLVSRNVASNRLKEILSEEVESMSWSEVKTKLNAYERIHHSRVAHFFAEIPQLLKSNLINPKLTRSLMYEYFYTWNTWYSKIIVGEKNLNPNEQSSLMKRVEKLTKLWIKDIEVNGPVNEKKK